MRFQSITSLFVLAFSFTAMPEAHATSMKKDSTVTVFWESLFLGKVAGDLGVKEEYYLHAELCGTNAALRIDDVQPDSIEMRCLPIASTQVIKVRRKVHDGSPVPQDVQVRQAITFSLSKVQEKLNSSTYSHVKANKNHFVRFSIQESDAGPDDEMARADVDLTDFVTGKLNGEGLVMRKLGDGEILLIDAQLNFIVE